MPNVNVQTPPPAMLDSIERKLSAIQKAARYLQSYSRDEAESASAAGIVTRAREIEMLLSQLRDREAAA